MDGMDAADIFAQFFGDTMFSFDPSGTGPRRRGGKSEDSIIPYEVSLEDLYNGKAVKMNMEKEIVCGLCKGCFAFADLISNAHLEDCSFRSGARGNAKPKTCVTCKGRRWISVQSQVRTHIRCDMMTLSTFSLLPDIPLSNRDIKDKMSFLWRFWREAEGQRPVCNLDHGSPIT